jgi:hypothetical protein
LYQSKAPFSVKTAAELTHTMYELDVTLPQSKHSKHILLKMNQQQALLKKIIAENF